MVSCAINTKGQDGKPGEPGKNGTNGKNGGSGGFGGNGGNGGRGGDGVVSISLASQNNPKEITDGILIGKAQKSDFQQEPFNEWYTSGFNAYKTNPEIIKELKNHTKDIKITLFMGTWCEDSQNQVPDFYKILEEIGYNEKNVTLITMKRDKTTPELFEKGLNITNVPTIIFYKNGKEINRIVESPVESLEKDMLNILSGKPYKHIYSE